MSRVEARKTVVDKGTCHEMIRHEHDAFGKVKVSKVQSNGTSLFGSALVHRSYVVIEVSRAHLDRHLNRDWVSDVGEDDIVRFALSEAQWAQMVASVGCDTGIPVTLERAPERGTRIRSMPGLMSDPVKETFEKEMREAGRKAGERVTAAQNRLREYLKPGAKPPTKKEIEDLVSMLLVAGEHLGSNMGHIQGQFAETMEKTVQAAKTEIEAFVADLAMRTGIEALRNGTAPMLEVAGTADLGPVVEDAPASEG